MIHNKNDVVLQVERALAHMLAHDLNNALGAIDVLAGMILDDSTDAALYTSKIQMAAQLGRAQVQALRHAIPKPGQGHEMTRIQDAITTVQSMMTDGGTRVMMRDLDDVVISAGIAVATYILFHLISHVAGCVSGDVLCERLSETRIRIAGVGDIVAPIWPTPLWDVVMAAFDLSIESAANGFVLQWPAAPVV